MSPEERLDLLEAENARLLATLERLVVGVEALAGVQPRPQPESAPPRRPCRAPLSRPRRRRGGGREIQAPAPPAPVACLFCLQVIADESDADLLERLQAHSCPEGEQP